MTIVAEASDLSGPLLVVGAIVVAFTLGRALGRARRSPPDGGGEGEAGLAGADAQVERIEEAGGRVLREIDTFGKETVARIETRLRVLNELLLRAERVSQTMAPDEGGESAGRFGEVYRLADSGADANLIAERTGFERGEVDLILSLRKRSVPDENPPKGRGAT